MEGKVSVVSPVRLSARTAHVNNGTSIGGLETLSWRSYSTSALSSVVISRSRSERKDDQMKKCEFNGMANAMGSEAFLLRRIAGLMPGQLALRFRVGGSALGGYARRHDNRNTITFDEFLKLWSPDGLCSWPDLP